MRRTVFRNAIILAAIFGAGAAQAAVDIRVDLGSQTMQVTGGDGQTYVWPVSSARRGYSTPRGSYGVQSLQAMHYSRKYHNSPMPHSIFFAGGYAIHGTYETGALGRPASHGCIRIAPSNAALLYRMVQAEGARITISGGADRGTELAEAATRRRSRGRYQVAPGAEPEAPPLAYAPQPHSYEEWLQDPLSAQ